MHSGKSPCGGGDDLIVWHVAQVLSDVPAMPERVLELTVPVAPEHVRQRLTNRCARRHRLCKHRFGVRDVEGQHHRRAANRGWGEHPHLGELISDVQQAVANPQLDRHQPSIRNGDPAHLLGAKGVSVESDSALGALNDNVRSDRHEQSVATHASGGLSVVARPALPHVDRLEAHHACRKWNGIVAGIMNNRPTVSGATPPAANPPGGDGMQVRLLRFGSIEFADEGLPWGGGRLIIGTGAYGSPPIMPEVVEGSS
jgi:hypothetical protein